MTIAAVLGSKGREVVTIGRDETVAQAIDLLGRHRIGAVPVVDGARVEGIMSERDVIYCLRDHGAEVLDWPVQRVMTAPAVTVADSTLLNYEAATNHSITAQASMPATGPGTGWADAWIPDNRTGSPGVDRAAGPAPWTP